MPGRPWPDHGDAVSVVRWVRREPDLYLLRNWAAARRGGLSMDVLAVGLIGGIMVGTGLLMIYVMERWG